MTNPVPAPRRGPCGSRPPGRSNSSGPSGTGKPPNRRMRPDPRVVASIFTTAGFNRSATSANEEITGASVAVVRVRAVNAGAVGAEIAGCGVIEPATIRPIRNAMVAVRQTVTTTNRRVMNSIMKGGRGKGEGLLDQLHKRGFIEHGNPKRLSLLSLAARLCANNNTRRLLTDRIRHLRPQPFERSCGLLARHRLQGPRN